jgi:hypothetical protein
MMTSNLKSPFSILAFNAFESFIRMKDKRDNKICEVKFTD